MKEVASYSAHQQKGLLLNANEMSENLSAGLRQEIAQAVAKIEFNRYPDDSCLALRQAYADYMGLEASQILCGNGSDQMLGLMIGSFLGSGKKLLTFNPDFSMYDYYASSYEAGLDKFIIEPGKPLDMDAFIAYGKKNSPDLILFSNPNNPTGLCVSKKDIEKLLIAFDSIPVVIDEAYMEFADESMIHETKNWPNLYVTRTLSKAYGLAGLRLGFLISSPKNIEKLMPKKVVYAVGSVTQTIGCVVLGHASEFKQMTLQTIVLRDELIEKCRSFKSMTVYDSAANFVLAESENIEAIKKGFEQEGIVIRDYKDKNYIRITIGTPEQTKRVYAILANAEKELAA